MSWSFNIPFKVEKAGGWQPTPNAYVETDGVCYIDTGWMPTATGAYEMDFMQKDGASGSMYSGGASRYYSYSNTGQLYCGRSTVFTRSGFYFGTRCSIGVDNKNSTAHIIDTYYTIPAISWLAIPSYLIGARHNGATADTKGSARVWSFRVWDNGTLVHDFYPREMDGVVGLWDMVTQTFITGTDGNLLYGVSET